MVAVVMGESFANGLGKTAIVPQAAGLRPSENVVIRFQTASNIGQGRRAARLSVLPAGRKKGLVCNQAFVLSGGGKRDRTADLLHAMQALYQLSYTPDEFGGESGTRTPDTRIMIPLL